MKMSDRLEPAVTGALSQVLQQSESVLIAHVGLARYIDSEGMARWAFIVQDGTPVLEAAGMVALMSEISDKNLREMLE